MPHEPEVMDAAGPGLELTETLCRVSAEVLETMFFTEAMLVECEHGWIGRALSVRVGFDGSHSGAMWLALAPEAVLPVTSAFLGLEAEETGEEQRAQVVLELANILCGAVLSALWPESRLLLDAPRLEAWDGDAQGAWHSCLGLEEGMLAISLQLLGGRENS
jgi:CheY-specific phosphatase CheX